MKKAIALLLCLLCALPLAACKPAPEPDGELPAAQLEEVYDAYLSALVPTRVIGMPWSSPDELDPDSVLTTYEAMLYRTDRPTLDAMLVEDVCQFDASAVEAYALETFGMTAEQTRASSYYDAERGLYLLTMGIGGAWGVRITGASRQEDLLDIRYDLINALDEVNGHGVLRVRLNGGESRTYLSNTQWDVED